jgi:hypothetical protein
MNDSLIVLPLELEKVYNYFLGVFIKNKSTDINKEEYIQVKKAVSGSAIEDYFPLYINSLNKRGNWNFLTTDMALKSTLNFSLTNCSPILTNSSVNYRFLLNSEGHYLSNKTEFYNKFKDYDFIINFEPISKYTVDSKKEILFSKFNGKPIILKPDTGSVSRGILTMQQYDFEAVKAHVSDTTESFDNWSISEIFLPKIVTGYISTNRIYFLVTKINNKRIISYYYKEFMNYRAGEKFTGNINNPKEMLTNLYDDDEEFVRNRFIPHDIWLSHFESYQVEQIYAKLTSIFSIITNVLKDDLMCFNDNNIKGDKLGFHVYGIDALINDNCEVKILEINGAPAMNMKTRLYNVPNRIDYFDVIEEVVQKTIDKLYKPKNEIVMQHKFIEAFNGKVNKDLLAPLYYIPVSIATKYSFILHALQKRNWMQRTKNFSDKVGLFYGLRERYVTPYTNMNYYDEIINYKMSKRMKNAATINKIQGITYFLASKDGLYKQLLGSIGKTKTHKFHPHSIFVYYNDTQNLKEHLRMQINKMPRVNIWIAKPVHGSRGLGIKIFNNNDNVVDELYEYIKLSSTIGFQVIDDSVKNFNGIDVIVYRQQVFKYWMICEYIDKPRLLTHYNPGKKFNIRFYALLTMGKVPTLNNINTFSGEEVLNLYIFKDMMVYFTVLDYNKPVPDEYTNLDPKLLHDMRHLTNLEVINKLTALAFNTSGLRKEATGMLSNIFNKDELAKVLEQGKKMIIKTIEATKYELRPLNRFVDDFKGCFNLLAYDTMLDENNKLWLIEVNRGPDMMGLHENIGDAICEKMFDEIFSVTLDKWYGKKVNKLELFEEHKVIYDVVK